jgi:hypothetical protein
VPTKRSELAFEERNHVLPLRVLRAVRRGKRPPYVMWPECVAPCGLANSSYHQSPRGRCAMGASTGMARYRGMAATM